MQQRKEINNLRVAIIEDQTQFMAADGLKRDYSDQSMPHKHLLKRINRSRDLPGLQTFPCVQQTELVNFCPGKNQTLLPERHLPGQNADRIYPDNNLFAMIVGMKVGAMMGCV